MNNNVQDLKIPEEENINIKNEISYYLFFWPWFLLTITIALLGSYTYLRYTPNIYSSSAQVQITKSDASSSFLTTEVTSLFGTRVNVQNDISVITSNHILSQVVQRLDLQTVVTQSGRVKSKLLFNDNLPFKINFENSNKPQQWTLSISNNIALVSDGVNSYKIKINEFYKNDYFSIKINESLIENGSQYIINRYSLKSSTNKLKFRLKAEPGTKNGEIINLSIAGTNKQINDAVLNSLIEVITEDRIIDQRKLSNASIKFINKRLKYLTNTIDSISKETIAYQIKNNVYNSDAQTLDLLSNIVKENEASFNLKIQLEIANSLLVLLESQKNFEILPANIGIVDPGINELLVSYNTLLMERNTLLVSAPKNSPLVMEMNRKLNNLKKANLEGISRYIENLQVSISSYQKINKQTQTEVSSIPEKGYTLRTLAREFKFAEDLLVFLSQRKEEASISYVSVLPNIKILSYGMSNNFSVSPNFLHIILSIFP